MHNCCGFCLTQIYWVPWGTMTRTRVQITTIIITGVYAWGAAEESPWDSSTHKGGDTQSPPFPHCNALHWDIYQTSPATPTPPPHRCTHFCTVPLLHDRLLQGTVQAAFGCIAPGKGLYFGKSSTVHVPQSHDVLYFGSAFSVKLPKAYTVHCT